MDTFSTRHMDIEDSGSAIPDHLPPLESDQHVLLVFTGQAQHIQFLVEQQLVLGRRSPENSQPPDVDLAAFGAYPAGVSRRHCVLRREPGKLMVMDLGSSNGTKVNDYRLTPHSPFQIVNGDSFWLGRLQTWIYFKA
ncbi:MAG: FHA domain-containing protein [Chloroflexi bacterium]|nr:FHA domain-containing protein [Chloroflexota bacterium]